MVVAKLFIAGDQVPVIPLVDVVGKADKVAPEQIDATCVKVGIIVGIVLIELTITWLEFSVVHALAKISQTYVPIFKLLGLTIIGFCSLDVKPFGPVQ